MTVGPCRRCTQPTIHHLLIGGCAVPMCEPCKRVVSMTIWRDSQNRFWHTQQWSGLVDGRRRRMGA
jgi:hypothetical protein